jgi:beta-lactamase regulating signal transducer with metallopeptidase domain
MIKSQAKWAYYILILTALAYVIMMALSLDNTRLVREGWTSDLAKFAGTETTANINNLADITAESESKHQQKIGAFRDKLNKRTTDFIANPPDTTDTTHYTTILWTTLATVLLLAIFIKME